MGCHRGLGTNVGCFRWPERSCIGLGRQGQHQKGRERHGGSSCLLDPTGQSYVIVGRREVYSGRAMKRAVSLFVIAVAAGTAGCFLGDYPTTWEGRYQKAAQELRAAQDDRHLYALDEAAKASFELGKIEEAEGYARQALELAARFRDDWNYGNAIHDGHMVLGRVALRKGDVETAKRELLEAGKTPGSPQLDSFGPNVSLAKDFLERNEADTVIAYFELCGEFWEMEDGNLKRWSALAKGGVMPEFGANLVY